MKNRISSKLAETLQKINSLTTGILHAIQHVFVEVTKENQLYLVSFSLDTEAGLISRMTLMGFCGLY